MWVFSFVAHGTMTNVTNQWNSIKWFRSNFIDLTIAGNILENRGKFCTFFLSWCSWFLFFEFKLLLIQFLVWICQESNAGKMEWVKVTTLNSMRQIWDDIPNWVCSDKVMVDCWGCAWGWNVVDKSSWGVDPCNNGASFSTLCRLLFPVCLHIRPGAVAGETNQARDKLMARKRHDYRPGNVYFHPRLGRLQAREALLSSHLVFFPLYISSRQFNAAFIALTQEIQRGKRIGYKDEEFHFTGL